MNDRLKSEIAEIRNDLKRDNVRRALNRLSDLIEGLSECPPQVATTSILLMQEFARVEAAKMGGRLSHAEVTQEVADISGRTLDLLVVLRDLRETLERAPSAPMVGGVAHESGPILWPAPRRPTSHPQSLSLDGEPVIEACGISRNFKASGFQLDPLDLKVLPGIILAIIGMNGSGKSTLLDILRGEAVTDSGTIRYPALSRATSDWATIRGQIGYVAQRSQPWRGTVLANLEYAAAVHGITGEQNVEWTSRLLARHGLTLYRDRKWNELSAGFRVRFDLALARINKPKLLILDEPLGNLDIVSQQSILFDLVQLARSTRTAIIITSQHLYETETIADDLLLLAGGKRVPSHRPLSQTFFEFYWPRAAAASEERIYDALEEFKPTQIKVQTTLCLIGLATRPSLEEIVAKAREKGLAFIYVRDVTNSKRIEMEQSTETLAV